MGVVEEKCRAACKFLVSNGLVDRQSRWIMSTFSQIILTPVALYLTRVLKCHANVSLLLLFVLSKAYLSTQTSGTLHPSGALLDSQALAPCQGRVPSNRNW